MAVAELNGAAIADEASFHQQSREAFGFPATYADSIDAWVDCMSYLRDDENMTKFRLEPNEVLQIVILDADRLKAAAPDLLEELTFCVGGINERYEDYGEKPALELILR
ncbi:barstar family protein [Telluria beijingensis]|uniref:barstar family protein n=1 Tax=Telluria beijingensis TaxID=3068633 RepID=UPI0027959668|nr:barstar family protein [Massilia sp. REN29]